jgi:hypothetical protein
MPPGRRRPRGAWSKANRRVDRDISNAPPPAVYGLTCNPCARYWPIHAGTHGPQRGDLGTAHRGRGGNHR